MPRFHEANKSEWVSVCVVFYVWLWFCCNKCLWVELSWSLNNDTFCSPRKKIIRYYPGARLNIKTVLPGIGSPIVKITARGRFKNAYEVLNLRALKISMLYKSTIFQCMGKIFCVEFQRVPLKFHTKYHTHTLIDVDFIYRWKFKSS